MTEVTVNNFNLFKFENLLKFENYLFYNYGTIILNRLIIKIFLFPSSVEMILDFLKSIFLIFIL